MKSISKRNKIIILCMVIIAIVSTYLVVHANEVVKSYSSNMQTYTVPSSGAYKIEAYGGKGADWGGHTGGYGGYAVGTFDFNAGDVINIYTGSAASGHSRGTNPWSPWYGGEASAYGGGGAATVVMNSTNTSYYLIAGGGGGASDYANGGNGGTSIIVPTGDHAGESGAAGGGGGSNRGRAGTLGAVGSYYGFITAGGASVEETTEDILLRQSRILNDPNLDGFFEHGDVGETTYYYFYWDKRYVPSLSGGYSKVWNNWGDDDYTEDIGRGAGWETVLMTGGVDEGETQYNEVQSHKLTLSQGDTVRFVYNIDTSWISDDDDTDWFKDNVHSSLYDYRVFDSDTGETLSASAQLIEDNVFHKTYRYDGEFYEHWTNTVLYLTYTADKTRTIQSISKGEVSNTGRGQASSLYLSVDRPYGGASGAGGLNYVSGRDTDSREGVNGGNGYVRITPLHTHSYEWVRTKEPTCTEKGHEIYRCSGCGDVTQERDIDALGHDWETKSELNNSIENGHKFEECRRCHITQNHTYRNILNVQYENADGSFSDGVTKIDGYYVDGSSFSWLSDADTVIYQPASVNGTTSNIAKIWTLQIYRNTFTVTLNTSTGVSSVSKSPSRVSYRYGESISASASLEAGYDFGYWLADDGSEYYDNPYIFTVIRSITLTATTSSKQYRLYFDFNTPLNSDDIQSTSFVVDTDGLSYDADLGLYYKLVSYNTRIGTLPSPYVYGWKFKGWYLDSDLHRGITENTLWNTNSDAVLKIDWSE